MPKCFWRDGKLLPYDLKNQPEKHARKYRLKRQRAQVLFHRFLLCILLRVLLFVYLKEALFQTG